MTLLLSLLLTGCLAEVDVNTDPDADGLSDAEEVEAGTDRGVSDSDEDGFSDGEELDLGTDPLSLWDRPYDRACRDSTTASGTEVGSVASDFELTNQYGGTTRLYDYCAHAILLVNAGYT